MSRNCRSGRRILLVTALLALARPVRAEISADELIRELGLKEADTPVRAWRDWRPPKKVVVLVDTPARLGWMQAAAPGVKLVGASSEEAAVPLLKDADAMIGFCIPGMFRAAPRLRWIQSRTAGVETCVSEEPIKSGHVLLTNMQRIAGSNMAEHVIAMMLALTRGLPAYLRAQEREAYSRDAVPRDKLWEVNGRTMLVVGLGGIGTEVARRAHALGMKVIATRNSGRGGPDFVSYVGKADELLALTPQADVIVASVPLTAKTKDLFNAAFFARMKENAYFINVGRGESVQQDDLIAVLNAGRIGGAGLDVTSPEPLPKGHPLWHARNVIITPHISGRSDQRPERAWILNRENLRRYVAGEKLLSVVDPVRGY